MAVTREEIFAEVKDLVQIHSTQNIQDLSEDTNLLDFGVDSLDLMDVIFRLEENYSLPINTANLSNNTTLGHLIDYTFEQIERRDKPE